MSLAPATATLLCTLQVHHDDCQAMMMGKIGDGKGVTTTHSASSCWFHLGFEAILFLSSGYELGAVLSHHADEIHIDNNNKNLSRVFFIR
jgi:hypothetical protein